MNTEYNADNPFEETTEKSPSPRKEELFQEKTKSSISSPPKQTIQPTFGSQDLTPEALDRKEMELNRKREDIERREKELLTKEKSLSSSQEKKKNWPKCRPFLFHDISEDIPSELQSLVRRAYFGWFVIAATFLWNIICILSVLVVIGSGQAIGSFFLAIVFAIFSIPVSFLIYRLLYNAAKKSSSTYYVLYFIVIWIEIVIFIILAIGIDGGGAGGFFTMLEAFDANSKTVGIFCVVCFLLFVALALYHIFAVFPFATREWKKAKEKAASEKGGKTKTTV
jgi:hypothetical protein